MKFGVLRRTFVRGISGVNQLMQNLRRRSILLPGRTTGTLDEPGRALLRAVVAVSGRSWREVLAAPEQRAVLVGLAREQDVTHLPVGSTDAWLDTLPDREPTVPLPEPRGPLAARVAELVAAIGSGARQPEPAALDLLVAHERANRLGGPLHAVVRLHPVAARAATGPLAGLAVAVKDNVDVAGSPRGNGNPTCEAGPARACDAPVVARLRAAGAEVFASASLLEYAAGVQHPGLPEARNPVQPARTAGGSSGGSAALVAAGVCRLAIGTDTGGSIRIPAAYCGVVGLKPSYALLPVEGVEPLSPSLDHVGLLAADVPLLRRALSALTGAPQGPSAGGRMRLGLLADQLRHPATTPLVAATVSVAIEQLRVAGHQVVELDGRVLDELGEVLEPVVLHEAWLEHRDRLAANPGHYGPLTLGVLQQGAAVGERTYRRALARRQALLPAAAALLEGVDALVGPSVPYVAPATTPPFNTEAGDAEGAFTAPYNVTGQPALTLPCGTAEDGLPVGLQLAGALGRDDALLALAEWVESELRTTPAGRPARW